MLMMKTLGLMTAALFSEATGMMLVKTLEIRQLAVKASLKKDFIFNLYNLESCVACLRTQDGKNGIASYLRRHHFCSCKATKG